MATASRCATSCSSTTWSMPSCWRSRTPASWRGAPSTSVAGRPTPSACSTCWTASRHCKAAGPRPPSMPGAPATSAITSATRAASNRRRAGGRRSARRKASRGCTNGCRPIASRWLPPCMPCMRTEEASGMQSCVITAPQQAQLQDAARPNPGPGQVLLRLEGSGVCASSLPVWEGREWFQYPQPAGGPGHEGWGRIAALGDGVTGLELGDRVAALTYRAHAEYDVADAKAVVKLPASLAGKAVPGEPLGCAVNIFRRSDIRAGQTVAIVGIGFLGALLTQLATHAGARVIAVSRRADSLEFAKRFGARHTVVM